MVYFHPSIEQSEPSGEDGTDLVEESEPSGEDGTDLEIFPGVNPIMTSQYNTKQKRARKKAKQERKKERVREAIKTSNEKKSREQG